MRGSRILRIDLQSSDSNFLQKNEYHGFLYELTLNRTFTN
ncbi:hypothetical protein LEP1GSC188_4191 [Leptospira weilii serovar Topaz str. LT2116]|uniref:Uncharacterized protein n=1 Tax=Leptospira weilii serovar Topaz str. LT2116 TaxID=1088540 RepID=M3GDR9_9LEPT|nr:hypothetical protein LEP1GSC188_4191 [Leptospira weilii serovar Topaz str. LT2116]